MSALEQIVARREGIPLKQKKRSRWDRIDRELDELEAKIDRLLEEHEQKS